MQLPDYPTEPGHAGSLTDIIHDPRTFEPRDGVIHVDGVARHQQRIGFISGYQGETDYVPLRACLKTPERGCVVLDQPQQLPKFRGLGVFLPCCGWSSTQPRSIFRQALKGAGGWGNGFYSEAQLTWRFAKLPWRWNWLKPRERYWNFDSESAFQREVNGAWGILHRSLEPVDAGALAVLPHEGWPINVRRNLAAAARVADSFPPQIVRGVVGPNAEVESAVYGSAGFQTCGIADFQSAGHQEIRTRPT